MINWIIGLIVIATVGTAMTYLVKEKKKGVKCIGCPHASSCAGCRTGSAGTIQDKK